MEFKNCCEGWTLQTKETVENSAGVGTLRLAAATVPEKDNQVVRASQQCSISFTATGRALLVLKKNGALFALEKFSTKVCLSH